MKLTHVIAALVAFSTPAAAMADSYAFAELEPTGRVSSQVVGSDRPGALYEAGSIGKFACTVAVLRLADRGLLDIDAELSTLLPSVADSPIAPVTLRQVLQSRSGIADGLLPAFRSRPQEVLAVESADEAVASFATGELANRPGTTWSYILVNWIVVQAVLERVAEEPVATIIEQTVLRPAGMGQSQMFVGQIGEDAQPPAEEGLPIPGFLSCAGGLATTPTDLLALTRFVHFGGLSEASLEALTQIATPEESYALGGRFVPRGDSDPRLLSWQTGSNGAYKSLVVYDPVTDTGFAAMTATGDGTEIEEHRDRWTNSSGL